MSFNLGVDSVLRDKWAFRKGMWRKLTPKNLDEKWFSDYHYGIAETKDMLECWLNFLPGAECWEDYEDFSVTFDMDEVKTADWTEFDLREMLADMASYVKLNRVIHAEEPYQTYRHDDYGTKVYYYRHPAIEALKGMIDEDSPHDLDLSG